MRFAQHRCTRRRRHARISKRISLIGAVLRYVPLVPSSNFSFNEFELLRKPDSELLLIMVNFFDAFLGSYHCFFELSVRWSRLADELNALQDQVNNNRVTRPLYKSAKIQRLTNRVSDFAVELRVQMEGNLYELYEIFIKEVHTKGITDVPPYKTDFLDIFHIIGIRMRFKISDYIKSVVHDEV